LAVSCIRVFGRCNLRVAVAVTLASRKRFETYVIAPKTSSERIVSSGFIEIDLIGE
jgi:hypothetical protein